MPRLATLSNSAVFIYVDHAPPHFHVRGPNANAVIDIETLSVVRGSIDRKDLAEAIGWAAENMETLWSEWRRVNELD
jgi:hypothetical protein